ncbi:conserved hypothetical protein [Sphingomonas sp. EC-HK361]|uniref:DUF983 domain-containing protein n=1 Tax=Sphingomonas sp. EC-HK361 TaxID=2038397 RepID=UPI0012595AC1|nr:conserved hypothetical protein [Sphingomonas sp. EC-HK361]
MTDPTAESERGAVLVSAPRPIDSGLKGVCPRCGAPTLFAGPIRFADRCRACGLDFSTFNVGDGPAAFLTLILGTIVVILAITVELTLHPPLWLHMLIWIPVTLVGVVASLRLAKGWLIALEYRNAAREGRIEPR